jgi:hypothetical protein
VRPIWQITLTFLQTVHMALEWICSPATNPIPHLPPNPCKKNPTPHMIVPPESIPFHTPQNAPLRSLFASAPFILELPTLLQHYWTVVLPTCSSTKNLSYEITLRLAPYQNPHLFTMLMGPLARMAPFMRSMRLSWRLETTLNEFHWQ